MSPLLFTFTLLNLEKKKEEQRKEKMGVFIYGFVMNYLFFLQFYFISFFVSFIGFLISQSQHTYDVKKRKRKNERRFHHKFTSHQLYMCLYYYLHYVCITLDKDVK